MSQEDPRAIPDDETLKAAYAVELFDNKGSKVPFESILKADSGTGKTVVVLVRHFFCGVCQEYVSQLANVKEGALKEAGVEIVIIGCGEWDAIKMYQDRTGFKGPIYANPTRELYQILKTNVSLARTPKGAQRRSYAAAAGSLLSGTIRGIWGPIKNPGLISKQGNISQVGGDFIFDADKRCIYAYRMQHTEDHIDVPELMKEAGVVFP